MYKLNDDSQETVLDTNPNHNPQTVQEERIDSVQHSGLNRQRRRPAYLEDYDLCSWAPAGMGKGALAPLP
jgi:hypothetical protein